MGGAQEQVWRDFYEAAWRVRADFVAAEIRSGETNAYRIIKKLQAHERKFHIKSGDTVRYEPYPFPEDVKSLPGKVPAFRETSFRGKPLVVSYHARDNLHDFIIDYMGDTGPYDCIVELGCGYGRNFFEIFYGGGPQDVPYFGGEFTDSGVALARRLAALEPGLDATFFHFDHTAPDLSPIPACGRALVFTVHSIEQVKTIEPELFRAITGIAKHVTGIHLEPFGFQVADLGPISKAHAAFMVRRGWNLNFAEALLKARDRFGLVVKFMATELFLPADAENPTSLAIWESAA